jgi:hypothetical protein
MTVAIGRWNVRPISWDVMVMRMMWAVVAVVRMIRFNVLSASSQ